VRVRNGGPWWRHPRTRRQVHQVASIGHPSTLKHAAISGDHRISRHRCRAAPRRPGATLASTIAPRESPPRTCSRLRRTRGSRPQNRSGSTPRRFLVAGMVDGDGGIDIHMQPPLVIGCRTGSAASMCSSTSLDSAAVERAHARVEHRDRFAKRCWPKTIPVTRLRHQHRLAERHSDRRGPDRVAAVARVDRPAGQSRTLGPALPATTLPRPTDAQRQSPTPANTDHLALGR
jgi:hypothetical protein